MLFGEEVAGNIGLANAGEYLQDSVALRVKKWTLVLITRSFAVVPTVLVALVFDQSANELDVFNTWLNVLHLLLLPFAVMPFMFLVAAWVVTSLVIVINLYLLFDFAQTHLPHSLPIHVALLADAVLCLAFTAYLAVGPNADNNML